MPWVPVNDKIKERQEIDRQGTKKDTVTTLLLKTNNENFAELFNRALLMDEPVCPDELDDEDIKEAAYFRITEDAAGNNSWNC